METLSPSPLYAARAKQQPIIITILVITGYMSETNRINTTVACLGKTRLVEKVEGRMH